MRHNFIIELLNQVDIVSYIPALRAAVHQSTDVPCCCPPVYRRSLLLSTRVQALRAAVHPCTGAACCCPPVYRLEMDRISKFAYPPMRIRLQIPALEAPRMRTRMRIFVTYLNNTSYCQMGAAFVTEYRLLHYSDYTEY